MIQGISVTLVPSLLLLNYLKVTVMRNHRYQIDAKVFSAAATVSTVIASLIADNYGRKSVLLLSCTMEIFGSIIGGSSFTKTTLLFGRLLQGLALGMFITKFLNCFI